MIQIHQTSFITDKHSYTNKYHANEREVAQRRSEQTSRRARRSPLRIIACAVYSCILAGGLCTGCGATRRVVGIAKGSAGIGETKGGPCGGKGEDTHSSHLGSCAARLACLCGIGGERLEERQSGCKAKIGGDGTLIGKKRTAGIDTRRRQVPAERDDFPKARRRFSSPVHREGRKGAKGGVAVERSSQSKAKS